MAIPSVWQSKKQPTVALSTAEAEYMAIGMVLQEVKWIHALLTELGLSKFTKESISMELLNRIPSLLHDLPDADDNLYR